MRIFHCIVCYDILFQYQFIIFIVQVTGLCGNFNSDRYDDTTLRGGAHTGNITKFANDWRMHNYCESSVEVSLEDRCLKTPERRKWATEQCSVISSKVFEACHSLVEYKGYVDRYVVLL